MWGEGSLEKPPRMDDSGESRIVNSWNSRVNERYPLSYIASMYMHARQFPHLQGKTDQEIRLIVFQGLEKRPKYRSLMRARNVIVILVMVIGPAALVSGGLKLGLSMMIVGGLATALVLVWNLVWLNTILFRLTEEELGGRV